MNARPDHNTFAASTALPHNIEAEQALLGAIFTNPAALDQVEGVIDPAHFYEPLHREVFDRCRKLREEGRAVTPITLKPFFTDDTQVGSLTPFQYMVRLAAEATTIINAPDFARAIIEDAGRRALIARAEDAIAACRDPRHGLANVIEDHTKGLDDIARRLRSDDTTTLQEAASGHVANVRSIAEQASQTGSAVGFKTDLPFVDELIGPICPGQLVVVGGGVKQGKTSLAEQMIGGYAQDGARVFVLSYEMSDVELAARLLARKTGIGATRQKLGKVSSSEVDTLAGTKLDGASNIAIVKTRMTLTQIHARMRRERARGNVDILVVDHLGLIPPDTGDRGKAGWELAMQATRALKAIADQLGIAIIAVSQLKKNVLHQAGNPSVKARIAAARRQPKYADLAGAIEQDAYHVLIAHRAEAILAEIETPPEDTSDYAELEGARDMAQGKGRIILALSRDAQWPQEREVEWDGPRTLWREKRQRELV